MATDYYAILELTADASATEIVKAYKRLARRYHPDLNPDDPTAEDHLKTINEAYDALSHPEKKRLYDNHPITAQPKTPAPDGQPMASPRKYRTASALPNIGEIFEDLFGTGHRLQSEPLPIGGNDMLVGLTLDLPEAALGCEKLVRIRGGKRVKVAIPGGVESGEHIRIPGMGEHGRSGGRHGDLHLEISVRPHATFARDGTHILVSLPTPLVTAMFGGTVSVPTLDGPHTLTIAPGTQGGARIHLSGHGAVNRKTQKRGDLIATIDIQYPTSLSATDKAELKRIFHKATIR